MEDLISHTSDSYRGKYLALIQKIPIPITPTEIDRASRHITLAYFDQKSMVDRVGIMQGTPVCFDAKECAAKTFPLRNVHPYQIQLMEEFEGQGGISFIILYYTGMNEMYYFPFDQVLAFWEWVKARGRKSFAYDEVGKQQRICIYRDMLAHYSEEIQKGLGRRN